MKIDKHLAADHETDVLQRFRRIRAHTLRLCADLSAEDCMVQSMPDASPVKWHLAHTAWFFETFILSRAVPGRMPFDPQFAVLFNSYYVGVGARQPRPERGLLSRPSLDEVMEYSSAVDGDMIALLADASLAADLVELIELGLQHEQQHQELILTDIKHHFWRNPLHPVYQEDGGLASAVAASPLTYLPIGGGLQPIGHEGTAFCFDNETPHHQVWLAPCKIANRLVTNGEYLAFMQDGGYRRPELWLSDGWDARTREGWEAPLYWMRRADDQPFDRLFTLQGDQPMVPDEALCHVSFYEADAYARWAGARLPTEYEWEHAVRICGAGLQQAFDEAWQWTNSAYLPYPGFHPAAGAVGEYNGKFMINQMVLRGSSCATPQHHSRASYRNFFPPHVRWQFSGIRLARDK